MTRGLRMDDIWREVTVPRRSVCWKMEGLSVFHAKDWVIRSGRCPLFNNDREAVGLLKESPVFGIEDSNILHRDSNIS